MVSERVSLLAPYVKQKQSFRCPGDKKLWRVNNKILTRPRNFGMNAYVGWSTAPYNNMPNEQRYQVFRRSSQCRLPSSIFLFGEINPDSLCRPMFGVNMDSQGIYHFPGNYHGRVSNFAFLDGHAELHRWRDGQFNDPRPVPANWHDHGGNTAKPSSASDLAWLKERTTIRK
jgi:prepilin-type processing-associated H-X9-DG protein